MDSHDELVAAKRNGETNSNFWSLQTQKVTSRLSKNEIATPENTYKSAERKPQSES